MASFDMAGYRRDLATRVIGRRLDHHTSVTSTMDLARDLAATDNAHGAAVLADEQTAGRGRRGRSFYSPAGDNLYFTVVLEVSLEDARALPLRVSLAVVEAIRRYCPDAAIKWPNDIWIGGRKCSGMLIDAQSAGPGVTALVGIGINVNGDPRDNPELRDIATSLALERGAPVEREVLLAGIMNRLEATLETPAIEVVRRYRDASNTIGRAVTVHPAAGTQYDGIAEDIDESGALHVRQTDGHLSVVDAADVSLRQT